MLRNRSLLVLVVSLLVHAGCGALPGPKPPTPTPTPPPPPTTTTTTLPPIPAPLPPECPVKVGKGYYLDLVVTRIGGNPQLFTATAKYCGLPVRSDLFPSCGTKCCVLGVDGVSDAAIICEKQLSGEPVWRATPGLSIVTPLNNNPYNCKIASGQGTLEACGISGCSNEISYP